MRRLHEKTPPLIWAVLLLAGALGVGGAGPAATPDRPADAKPPSGEAGALAAVVEAGQAKQVEELLDAGERVRARDAEGLTPLHRAARGGAAKIVPVLLDAGALIDASDEQGKTPLMHAAARGHEGCIRALIESGADALIKDKQGRTAAEIATAARQDKAARLLSDLLKARENALAVRVRPGDDLARILQQARDGQLILLLTGVHEGTIAVTGKSLIIRGEDPQKTILSSSQRQAAVVAGDKARLEIENLTIRTSGKTEFGVVAAGGQAIVRNCAIAKTSSHAALATQKGRVELNRCTLEQSKGPVVASTDGATTILRQCTVDRCKSGILSNGAAHLGVFDSAFIQTPASISSDGAQTTVCVLNNVTEQPFAEGGKVLQIVVQGGRRVVLADNRLINPPAGIKVTGALTNPALIERNAIINATSAIEFDATVAGERPAAVFHRNLIYHPRLVGLNIRNAGAVRLVNNLIHASQYGVVLKKASATLEQNLIYATRGIVILEDGATAQGSGERLIGPVDPALKLDDKTRRFTLAAESEALARPLRRKGDEFLAALAKIESEAGRAVAGPALKAFTEQIRAAEKLADELASVEIRLVDGQGVGRSVAVKVWPDLGGEPGHEELSAGDIRDGGRFLALIRERKSAVTRWLGEGLESTSATPSNLQEALKQISEHLYTMGLFDAALEDKTELSDKTRSLGEWLKRSKIEGFHLPYVLELNRAILEETLPDLVRCSRQAAESSDATPTALAAPGAYWIVPVRHPDLAMRVKVDAKQTARFEQEAEGTVWVNVASGDKTQPERGMLLSLRPAAERRVAARAWRSPPWSREMAAPRSGATARDIELALELARRELAQLTQPFDESRFPQEKRQRERQAYHLRQWYTRRIFTVAGDRGDSGRIIEACSRPQALQSYDWLNVAAHIEARLGVLETGAVAAAVSSSNPAVSRFAMVALYDRGVVNSRAKLLNELSSAPNLIYSLAGVSAGDESPEILASVRRVAGTLKQSKAGLPAALAIHLLASGNADDLRLLSECRVDRWTLATLIPFLSDRWPVIRELVEQGNWGGLPPLLPQLMDEGWSSAAEMVELAGDAMFHKYEKVKEGNGWAHYNQWLHDISYAWPSGRMAKAAYEKWPWLEANWIDRRWDERVALMVEKLDWRFLDYVPPAELQRRLGELDAGGKMPAGLAELLAASHTVSTLAFTETVSQYGGRIERRPITLRQDGDAGAIIGMLELRPSLEAGMLRCSVRIPRACYFQPDGTLLGIGARAFHEYPMHQYIRDDGRELLTGLKVLRDGQTTAMKPMGRDAQGWFCFELDLGRHDLAGVYVVTELSFFTQTHQVAIGLFDGELARRMRRDAARLAAIQPADRRGWVALAREQSNAGRLDEAWQSYRKALELEEDAATREEAIAMFSRARLYARAAAVIEETIARTPDRAELQIWLASARYGEGNYLAAAKAASRALELGAADPMLPFTRDLGAYLAGGTADHESAGRLIRLHAADDPGKAEALKLLAEPGGLGAVLKQSKSSASRCLALTCAGFAAMKAKDNKSARSHFQSALWEGSRDQVEYRMAQFALSKLETLP